MINVRRVLTLAALGFLLIMTLVAGSGCATMSYEELASATHLDAFERGVVVVNLYYPPQLVEVLAYAPGMATIWGPRRVYLQFKGSHAFVVHNAGNQSVTITAQPVDSNGRPIGRLESVDIWFPWGHEVGNAVDYRSRNHFQLIYGNGGLSRR